MNYAPQSSATQKVVEPGAFVFAASHFDHGHIYGQIGGLAAAGGVLKYVYDSDPKRYQKVLAENPGAKAVRDFREILDDPEVQLLTSAALPNLRCGIGIQAMDAGKHYLTDKAPFTSMSQLENARAAVGRTGKKYGVCYSERLLSESGWFAGELIAQGAIGRVLQVLNLAPHNLNAPSRPDWFFRKENYGGILTDIGSHQFEQFLTYSGATDGSVNFARVSNQGNPEYPELEDFGEASLTMNNGVSAYCRMDWFNPKASRTWGDGRCFVLGTEGYIDVRKYIDVCNEGNNKIFLVNNQVEQCIDCNGKVGFPFFGKFILDILNGTENAMTQAHAFKAAELSMRAQLLADAHR
jgi:predicted dehydrogenase